jgi:drug/metabolite transporter (DMT)-like permease
MFQKVHVFVSLLSLALAFDVQISFDTTAGENPIGEGQTSPSLDPFAEDEANNVNAKLLYCGSVVMVFGLVVFIYHSRGFVTVASIIAYVGALSSMSMLIRNCFVNHNFKYPQFLTATHFVATALVGSSILLYRRFTEGRKISVPQMDCAVKGLLPVAGAFVLSLAFSNNGLLLTNAHFYEMTGSASALSTAGLSVLIGRGFDMRLMPALGMISVSLFVVAFGEVSLSVLGLLCCVGGVLMRSIKSTTQHALMSGSEWKSMDPVEVAVWTSLTCFVLMIAGSLVTEGFAPFQQILAWGPFMAVLYTCIGASILNIAALFVLRELGPVATQIVGNLKGILAIVGAVATLGESLSTQQALGYTILMLAIYWYNVTDMAIKDEKKKLLEQEGDETTKIQKV